MKANKLALRTGIVWLLFLAAPAAAGETIIEKQVPLINAPQKLNGSVKNRFEQALRTKKFRETALNCAGVFLHAANIFYDPDSDREQSEEWVYLVKVAIALSVDGSHKVSKKDTQRKLKNATDAVNRHSEYLKERYEQTADHAKPSMILENILPCLQTAISFVVPDQDPL